MPLALSENPIHQRHSWDGSVSTTEKASNELNIVSELFLKNFTGFLSHDNAVNNSTTTKSSTKKKKALGSNTSPADTTVRSDQ